MSTSMDLLSKVLIFGAGAAIGAVVAWKYAKEKYERIANEKVEFIREDYRQAKADFEENMRDEEMLANIPDEYFEDSPEDKTKTKYENVASRYGSIPDDVMLTEEVIKMRKANGPRVISPTEYEEFVDDGYTSESLYYYADGVLTDDWDNVIEDVEEMVGEESLKHFGDYPNEPDTVYVLNDNHRSVYEILRDEDNFSDKYPEE